MSADDKAIRQDSLPFPPTPSASIAGRTMQESVYKRRVEPHRLPADSLNILIVLIDEDGSGLPCTFGGKVQTRHWTASSTKGSRTTASTQPPCARPRGVNANWPESSPRR